MADFVSGIGTVISSIFTALLSAFSGIGELVFSLDSTTGAIMGLQAFGWLAVALIGIPLATWLFSKGIGLVGRLFSRK